MAASHYIVPSIVAALVGVGGSYVAIKNTKPPVQYVQVKPSEMPKAATARIDKYKWEGLTQFEVDGLTNALLGKKLDIIIACADDARCGDLALDFDNAFESAKLNSVVERPFLITTKGITVSSQEVLDAIAKTTTLRPTLAPRPDDKPGSVVVAIGSK